MHGERPEWLGEANPHELFDRHGSINPNSCRRREFVERARAADAVPGVFVVREFAFAFVSFQEAGDEEFFRHRVELHSAGRAVGDDLVVVVELAH